METVDPPPRRNALPILPELEKKTKKKKDVAEPMEWLAVSERRDGVEKKPVSKSKSPKANKKVDDSNAPKSPTNEKEKKTGKTKKDVAPTSPKGKGRDARSVQEDRAPFELRRKVKKFGRDALYAYLLTKLDAFKTSNDYTRCANLWDLIKNPETRPTTDDFASITAEELYDTFMFGETEGNKEGANQFVHSFLAHKCIDDYSWNCMGHFETMMKEKTKYEEFMKLFKYNVEMIGAKWRIPFANENPKAVAALQKCYDEYYDPKSGKPRKLSAEEKEESEKLWNKEMIRVEKAMRVAQEEAENDRLKAAKALEKEKEQIRFKVGGAPPHLLKDVKKFGRDALYAYLVTKLDAFKTSNDYTRCAHLWDLIKNPETRPTTDDFASITAEELYDTFMFGETEGNKDGANQFVHSFLAHQCNDDYSWNCMRHFETMMKEKTKYAEFMKLFKYNVETIGAKWRIPFANENPKAVAALQECYDKYKDLDLETARMQ
ncbi:hypothetical protein MHU86_5409 [Fragilaria crotonensis]|nr:hypothetical protein MHU86_5409 [Fragilaria crotonensis]